jgi:hypothetical protein
MEATEMNPFITVKALNELLNNHENGYALRNIFTNQLEKAKDEELCLPELGELINQRYNE